MSDIVLEFSTRSQGLGAIQEAAYRIIAKASCQLDSSDQLHVCRLTPKSAKADHHQLRCEFLDLVTDENLREKVRLETSGIKDVILALAFGALASPEQPTG